jgi:hypothetical protein
LELRHGGDVGVSIVPGDWYAPVMSSVSAGFVIATNALTRLPFPS